MNINPTFTQLFSALSRRWWLIAWLCLGSCLFCNATFAQKNSSADKAWAEFHRFIQDTKSLRMDFVQSIASTKRTQSIETRGKMMMVKPSFLRWEAMNENGKLSQLILVDASKGTAWIYDPDLQQAIHQSTGIGGITPAELLLGTVALSKHFNLSVGGEKENIDDGSWLIATPKAGAKNDSGQFQWLRLKMEGGALTKIRVMDVLGRIVAIDFSHIEQGIHIDKKLFQFTPPKGVDVVEQVKK